MSFWIFRLALGYFWKAFRFDLTEDMNIIHACCRLHNFCINRRMPVISTHFAPCDVSEVDVSGCLVHAMWRTNVSPFFFLLSLTSSKLKFSL